MSAKNVRGCVRATKLNASLCLKLTIEVVILLNQFYLIQNLY